MVRSYSSNPIPVLEIENLTVTYETRKAELVAVRGVSFKVHKSQTVGLVGESGCGKSTMAFAVVGFLGPNGKIVEGSVRFEGRELIGRSESELSRLRGDRIAIVYQEPMQALNPSLTLGEQLAEVLIYHQKISKAEAWERSIDMLKRVYMADPEAIMRRYPHQISGGQQQRVVIAMALLNNPALLLMDEPTTALDVTVEAEVLDLLQELKKEFDAGILYITHHLGVIARVADYLCVIYAGELVEEGPVDILFRNPCHPYTRGLMACVPRLGESKFDSPLKPIPGMMPHPAHRPMHECVFAPRCPHQKDLCRSAKPRLQTIEPGHDCRCFIAEEMSVLASLKRRRQISQTREVHPSPAHAPIIKGHELKVYYPTQTRSITSMIGMSEEHYVKAVDRVNFKLKKGQTLGIVGESGCGKSTLVRAIIGLEHIRGGSAEFLGVDITRPLKDRPSKLIREMQMVFQNPDSTLNPFYSIGFQISRPLKKFRTVSRQELSKEVIRLLRAVHLDDYYYDRFPRQLSGGEKQRVAIARALASRPELLLCDEPVSSLDVSVQAAVINLLLELQNAFGTTMIFISHDLSVIRFFCDEVLVMYLGQVMEAGPAEAIYTPPYHPYTEALLSAVPIPDPAAEQKKIRLSGIIPSAVNPPAGCRFHTRCPWRDRALADGGAICERETPPWQETKKGHGIFCHIPLAELEKAKPVVHIFSD